MPPLSIEGVEYTQAIDLVTPVGDVPALCVQPMVQPKIRMHATTSHALIRCECCCSIRLSNPHVSNARWAVFVTASTFEGRNEHHMQYSCGNASGR